MKKAAAIALIMLGVGIIGVMFSFDLKEIGTFGTVPVLEKQTVSAANVDSVHVETSGLNMEIVRGSSEDIQVRIDGKASKKYMDRFQLNAEAKGNTVYIEGSYKDTFFVGFNIVSVDLVVELPEKLWKEVTLLSGSGNIEIEELQAEDAMLKSQSGNIESEDLWVKTLLIEAKSGNVKVDGYSAEQLTARAQSGNITLEDGSGIVVGETKSGNIRVIAESVNEDIKLKTDSGNVRIEVENEPSSAAIQFRTDSGNRNVDWKSFNTVQDNEEELSGTIGSGQIIIDVETDSGNLKLGKK